MPHLVHPFSVSTREWPHNFPHCLCPHWCSAALSGYHWSTSSSLSLEKELFIAPRLWDGEVAQGSHVKWFTDHWLPQMRRQQLHYLHHSCFVLQAHSHSFPCNKLTKKKHPFVGVTHLYNWTVRAWSVKRIELIQTLLAMCLLSGRVGTLRTGTSLLKSAVLKWWMEV